MSLARETDDKLVKPLEGATIRRYTAGSTIEAGEAVAMASDGQVDPADTSSMTLANVLGISLQDAVANDRIDVVVHGPVVCMTGATVGGKVYATDTAGEPSHTAGTKTCLIGIAESATILFVRPVLISQS
jgi:hypothetical protein